jgi:hypothetical protein
VGNI